MRGAGERGRGEFDGCVGARDAVKIEGSAVGVAAEQSPADERGVVGLLDGDESALETFKRAGGLGRGEKREGKRQDRDGAPSKRKGKHGQG